MIGLVFFAELAENEYKDYIQRVLCSYFETLQKLQMFHKATELNKYWPQLKYMGCDMEKKSPQVDLKCPFCLSNDAVCVGSKCIDC